MVKLINKSLAASATASAPAKSMGLAKKLGIGAVMGVALEKFSGFGILSITQVASLVGSLICCEGKGVLVSLSLQPVVLALVQKHLLTNLPKKLAPKKEAMIDSKIAKVIRIFSVTALYLGALHCVLDLKKIDPKKLAKIALSIMGSSVLQETRVGLPGVFALDVTSRLMSLGTMLLKGGK